MAAGSLVAVAGAANAAGALKSGQTVYFIPKDTHNPYEVIADTGGKKALTALGDTGGREQRHRGHGRGPDPLDPGGHRRRKPAAIVIAGNDPSALCPSPGQAQAAGIKVVSFDSDVTCPNHMFINQANTQQIGTSEVDLLGQGDRLPGPDRHPVRRRHRHQPELLDHVHEAGAAKPKYPKMKLVKIVYGNDDPATSLTVLQGLLSAYPNLRASSRRPRSASRPQRSTSTRTSPCSSTSP